MCFQSVVVINYTANYYSYDGKVIYWVVWVAHCTAITNYTYPVTVTLLQLRVIEHKISSVTITCRIVINYS